MPWARTPDLGTAGGAAGPAPRRPRLCEPRPRAPRSTSLEGLAHARGGGQGLAQTRSPKGRRWRRRSSVCRTVFYDEGPGPRRGWGRRVPPREIKTSHGVANRTQSRGGKEGEAEGGQGAGRPRPRATPRVLLTLSDSAREGGAEPGARGGPGPDQGAPWQRTGRRPAVGAGLADGAVLPWRRPLPGRGEQWVCTPHVARVEGAPRELDGNVGWKGKTGGRGSGDSARPGRSPPRGSAQCWGRAGAKRASKPRRRPPTALDSVTRSPSSETIARSSEVVSLKTREGSPL